LLNLRTRDFPRTRQNLSIRDAAFSSIRESKNPLVVAKSADFRGYSALKSARQNPTSPAFAALKKDAISGILSGFSGRFPAQNPIELNFRSSPAPLSGLDCPAQMPCAFFFRGFPSEPLSARFRQEAASEHQ
jgi:hypothetical protein